MDDSYLRLSTLVLAIFIGVLFFVFSRHLRVPTIILLLIGGVVLGPEGVDLIHPEILGPNLQLIITLSVAIILFEGGLTLHPRGIREAPIVIWGLLTVGVLITWLGAAALIYFFLDHSLPMSMLAGSLIIVTGPTVIGPLLKRINVREKIFHILHWEGVMIDPIGVFIAILCFEWLTIEGNVFSHILVLGERLLVGGVVGIAGGRGIDYLLRKNLIPQDQINIFVFASALLFFGVSDFFVHEAGILAVVVAGLVLGWSNPPHLKNIRQFKSELTEIAIALVFILLAANLKLDHFANLGWGIVFVILGVLFLLRPLSIFLCGLGSGLTLREKLFLSSFAPRGVVAGSMASLFGVRLTALGNSDAVFLESFTFSIIAATIIVQGLSASPLASLLRVKAAEKKGWLIVGAHHFSEVIARYITRKTGGVCLIVDSNAEALNKCRERGFKVIEANALSTEILPPIYSQSIGNVLALTDNRELNQLICENWSEEIRPGHLNRWSSASEEEERTIGGKGRALWSKLAKPTQVAYDLEHNHAMLREATADELEELASSNQLLLSADFERVRMGASDEPLDSLIYVPIAHSLRSLLPPRHVFYCPPASYSDILSRVIEGAAKLYPAFPRASVEEMLLKRENEFPTTLANGVAAPHIHCPELTKPYCFIAHVPEGIDLKTFDGCKVHLMFVLLSPKDQPELHLKLLAEIATIGSNVPLIEKLIAQRDAELFTVLLRQNLSK